MWHGHPADHGGVGARIGMTRETRREAANNTSQPPLATKTHSQADFAPRAVGTWGMPSLNHRSELAEAATRCVNSKRSLQPLLHRPWRGGSIPFWPSPRHDVFIDLVGAEQSLSGTEAEFYADPARTPRLQPLTAIEDECGYPPTLPCRHQCALAVTTTY